MKKWRTEASVCPVSLSPDSQCSKKKTAKEKRQWQERTKEINECAGHSSVTLATFLQQTPCELSKGWRCALPHRGKKSRLLPWLAFLTQELEKWLKVHYRPRKTKTLTHKQDQITPSHLPQHQNNIKRMLLLSSYHPKRLKKDAGRCFIHLFFCSVTKSAQRGTHSTLKTSGIIMRKLQLK